MITEHNNTINRILTISTFIVILALFIVPIFYKGLFFAFEYNGIYVLSGVGVLLALAYRLTAGGYKPRINYLQISLLVLLAGYALSIFTSVLPEQTYFALKKYGMLFLIVCSSCLFFNNKRRQIAILTALYFSGVFVAVIGIDYFAERKFIHLINDILHYFNIYGTSILNDYPLSQACGVFQYSNLYAAYCMVIYFIGLLLLFEVRAKAVKGFIAVSMFLQVYMFVLTLSRGGYLVWGIILLGYIVLAKGYRRQIIERVILTSVPAFLLLMMTYRDIALKIIPVNNIWLNTVVMGALSIVIITGFYYIGKSAVVRKSKWIKSMKRVVYAGLAIGIGAVVISVIGGIDLQKCFTAESIVSRGHYLRLWVQLFGDSPVTGYGGGAWQELAREYSAVGYIYSRFPHSYILKTSIEAGLLGIVGMGMLWYAQLRGLWRNISNMQSDSGDLRKLTLSIITLGILLHSSIDFIFVFGYMMMIYLLLASFGSEESVVEIKSFRRNGP